MKETKIFIVCFYANYPNSDPTICPDYYQWYEAYETSDDFDEHKPCALQFSHNHNNKGWRILVMKEFVRAELGSSAIVKFINWQNSSLTSEDLIR
jgi:hypothetical protein